jgi:hypothetical protein
MALTPAQLTYLRHSLGKHWTNNRDTINVTKAELYAAVEALDLYFDTKAAEINNTIPAAARTGLTAPQKAKLAAEVMLSRYQAGG